MKDIDFRSGFSRSDHVSNHLLSWCNSSGITSQIKNKNLIYKGKERKGKGRKGKERQGKERKG
jgi:hypothetical protein